MSTDIQDVQAHIAILKSDLSFLLKMRSLSTHPSDKIYITKSILKCFNALSLLQEELDIMLSDSNYVEPDIFGDFIDECLEYSFIAGTRTFDSNSKLHLDDIFFVFDVWIKVAYPDSKSPSKSTLKDELCKRLGQCNNDLTWDSIKIHSLIL